MADARELFDLCATLTEQQDDLTAAYQTMHEMVVVCCAEGTRDTGQGYGSLQAQLDYVCRHRRVSSQERAAIQTMRRHSNRPQEATTADLPYDVRALVRLVSAVFTADVPGALRALLPSDNRTVVHHHADLRYVRCIVSSWDDSYAYADSDGGELRIELEGEPQLKQLLWQGAQLNLLDSEVVTHEPLLTLRPLFAILEPDFLIDTSAVAATFADKGHNPLAYTVSRLKPRTTSQAMLLGNFAGTALDDIIAHPDGYDLKQSVWRSFREQLLPFCACNDFDATQFMTDARQQTDNLRQVVRRLFSDYDRNKALLEPSFVCEQLGLQGRVDLMTADLRLLVEQKSGRNFRIEKNAAIRHREDHYIQLLLYYGILYYNFSLSADRTDIRLLYSKYAPDDGLLVVPFYRQLLHDAIVQRNAIVAWEYYIARQGFDAVLPHICTQLPALNPLPSALSPQPSALHAQRSNLRAQPSTPNAQRSSLHTQPSTPNAQLPTLYYTTFTTFVYREQLRSRVGAQQGQGHAVSDLWNMPLAEKLKTGNIYLNLSLTDHRQSSADRGYDLLTLTIGETPDDFMPNFRRGDLVYVYAYHGEPDVRRAILYKGTLAEIATDHLVVRLTNGQHNSALDTMQATGGNDNGLLSTTATYAVEHGGSDSTTSSLLRSLYDFLTAPPPRRDLLLAQRAPRADTTRSLSRSYHPHYDDIVLRAKQACDYFLLVGPPGTGKTSMALRFLIEEELAATDRAASILLTAYTNRAVDEICAMLADAGISFLRLGQETSADPRFAPYLLPRLAAQKNHISAIKAQVSAYPVVVATTSLLLSQPYIFHIKQFSLCMVDEASQILEPGLVGLLSRDIPRFILIGDHKQLPAVVQQSPAETRVDNPQLRAIGLTDCRRSLFERLIDIERHAGRSQFVGTLRHQGRMHPELAAFPNRMFYADERLQPVPLPHQQEQQLDYTLPALDALDSALKTHRLLFLPAATPADEAVIVADLLRRIHRYYGHHFDADKTVGVIVPYRHQIALIRRETERWGIEALRNVSIDTVERYQGSQRDVIIFSFTVATTWQLDFLTANTFEETVENTENSQDPSGESGETGNSRNSGNSGESGPLSPTRLIDRKLNVAITRARKQLLLTGNEPLLCRNDLLRQLLSEAKRV